MRLDAREEEQARKRDAREVRERYEAMSQRRENVLSNVPLTSEAGAK